MATTERAADRGRREANEQRIAIGRELREGRIAANVSQARLGASVGVSASSISRIERGLVRPVSLQVLAEIAAVLGLRVTIRLYPVGQPLRDAAQIKLLAALRGRTDAGLRWRAEVPLDRPGDLRAWDASISGRGWTLYVDAETRIRDAQALARRTALKQRETPADRVLLLVADTRSNRAVLRAIGSPLIADALPGRHLLDALAAGRDPGGSGVILL